MTINSHLDNTFCYETPICIKTRFDFSIKPRTYSLF